MSDSTEQIEADLQHALGVLRTNWAAMLEQASTAGGTPSADEVTSLDRRISLIYEAHLCLNGWARVIVEDRPVTKVMPDGRDTIGLIDFIDRHAQWFSGHEAAKDAVDEISEWAEKIRSVTAPKVREYVYLGDCPFVIGDEAAEWFCAGRVRVKIGGDAQDAECSDCGQEGVVDWWEEVLGIDTLPTQPVTAAVIAELLHDRLHMKVSHRTVLNWARAKRITMHVAFGPQPEEPRYTVRSVFDARLVLDEATRMWRECPMCGLLWHGRGDVCARCYSAMQVAQKRYAEPKEAYPVVSVPRRLVVVASPTDTDRPNRCHYSDLPTQWCACGHAGHTGA